MKAILIPTMAALAMASALAKAEDAQGIWSGRIANALTVSVQFNKPADGPWEATLSVPAQNVVTKVQDLVVTPDTIGFALPAFHASYAATWNAQEQAWQGTWTQGQTVPLNLKRTSAEQLKPKRPQEEAIAARTPAYTSADVTFANAAAHVDLAGTMTVPHGKGPFPAVVLVQGSGPVDRDEEVAGHKVLLVLADYLSSRGILVLRYDKRGTGKSSGNWMTSTTLDLASDAEAALRFLRARPDVDGKHVGVIGHSEGGLIAPLLASRDPALGFVVMLAGPGVRGERLLPEQFALMAKAQGAADDVVARQRAMYQAVFSAMAAEPDLERAMEKAGGVLVEAEQRGGPPAAQGKQLLQRFGKPWFHALLNYDPIPVLAKVRQPILVLNGELDQQVPAALDLPPIRTALQGNPHAVVKAMPGLNHLFQTAKTGAGFEYVEIAETFAPAALATIGDWIVATVR